MALKELLTNLPAALSAYPFSSNPSTAGGANYGNSYTAPFDAQSIRQRPFGPTYGTPTGMPSYGDTSYPFTGAPLVTIGLPPVDKESNEILNYVDLVSGGFIRGGLVTAGKRAALDTKRIGKFMISPKGITFIIKQVALQASNPKLEEPSVGPFQKNRTYNLGINTLAQIPVNFTGLHINRAGLSPLSYGTETGYKVDTSNTTKYGPYYRLRSKDDNSDTSNYKNRLLKLWQTKVEGESKSYSIIGSGQETLLSYSGGPNSVGGIGKTDIKRYYSSRNFEWEAGGNSNIIVNFIKGLFSKKGSAISNAITVNITNPDTSTDIANQIVNINLDPETGVTKNGGTLLKTRPITLEGEEEEPNSLLGASLFYKKVLEINPNLDDKDISHSLDTILPKSPLQKLIKNQLLKGPLSSKVPIILNPLGLPFKGSILIGNSNGPLDGNIWQGFLGASTVYTEKLEINPNKPGINHNHQYLTTGTWPNLPTNAKYYPYYGDLKSHISTEEKESPFTIFNKQRGNTRVILPNYIQLGGPVSSLLYINNSSLLSQNPGVGGVIPWEDQIPVNFGFNVQLDTDGNPIEGSNLITNPLGASFHYEGYIFEQNGEEVNINPNEKGEQIDPYNPGLPPGVGVQNPDNTVIDTSIYSALILNKGDGTARDLTDPNSLNISDFRKTKVNKLGQKLQSSDYQTQNLATRIKTGTPGNLRLGHLPYNVSLDEGLDKINALDIFSHEGEVKDERAKDLIKFRIEAIDTDNPSRSDVIIFRAFLENFNDGFTGNWGEVKYAGRGEPLYLYNGFKRSITTTFKVAAQARCELEPLYRKLNFLASNTAPDYGGGTRMRAPYVRLTIGDYFSRLPGFFTGLTFSWKTDYPWEIVLDPNDKDKNMLELPHMLDIQMNFTPIHNFLPQKSITRSTFILPHARDMRLKQEQKWYSREAADGLYEVKGCGTAPLPQPPIPPPPPPPIPDPKPKNPPIYIPPNVTLKKDDVQTAGQDIEGDGNSIGIHPGDRYGEVIPPKGGDKPIKWPPKK